MTTELVYDVFLNKEINTDNDLCNKTISSLAVVHNDNPENEINLDKANNEKREIKIVKSLSENPENEILISKGKYRRCENREIKSLYSQKVEREMIKGYMQLLSNLQN